MAGNGGGWEVMERGGSVHFRVMCSLVTLLACLKGGTGLNLPCELIS